MWGSSFESTAIVDLLGIKLDSGRTGTINVPGPGKILTISPEMNAEKGYRFLIFFTLY
jgi:hypothetical protein